MRQKKYYYFNYSMLHLLNLFITITVTVHCLQQCKTSGQQLLPKRPKKAELKTFKVFFESLLFQQVSCGKDEINGVCKNAKQC